MKQLNFTIQNQRIKVTIVQMNPLYAHHFFFTYLQYKNLYIKYEICTGFFNLLIES